MFPNSLDFGTVKQMKKDMVTEIAATLAFFRYSE